MTLFDETLPEKTPELLRRPLALDRRTRPVPAPTSAARPAPTPLSEASLFDDLELDVEVAVEPPAIARAPTPAPQPQAVAVPVPVPAPAKPPSTTAIEIRAAPASLPRRVGAWCTDVGVVALVVGGLAGLAQLVVGRTAAWGAVAIPLAILFALLLTLYATAAALLLRGRTLGLSLFGLSLVDGTGQAPSPSRALWRTALSVVSLALLSAGYWLSLFDAAGQALHDKLTGTFVVQLRG